MMIGGETDVVKHLDPIFATLAPGRGDIPRTPGREKVGGTAEQGYLHCGPNGAGHFVKMVHNGIEYGLMAAYAEGLAVLKAANIGKKARRDRCRNHAAARSRTLPVRPQPARHRRSLAPRQRDRVVAARSLGGGPDAGSRADEFRRPGVRFRRRPLDHQGRHRRRRAGPCAVRRRSTSGSARAARRTSPTSCCRPCATSSAGISKNRQQNARDESRSNRMPQAKLKT